MTTFPIKMKAINVAAPQTQSVMRSAVTQILDKCEEAETRAMSDRSVPNLKPIQQSGTLR